MATEGGRIQVRIGLGSCGIASGALAVRAALLRAARRFGLPDECVKPVGCNGMCHREPLVEVVEPDVGRTVALYGNVQPGWAGQILLRHARARGLVGRMRALTARARAAFAKNGEALPADQPVSLQAGPAAEYLGSQQRIVLENCGQINPLSIDDYIARGGYEALRTALTELSPEAVIDAVGRAGLRGRGGAGFPTARKWAICRSQQQGQRFAICNGDEGDPGAFMDRLVLESDPHRVLEGLALAAYAIGATRGFFYIRAEYPLAVRHVREAIRQAQQRAFLGQHIFGTEFSLELQVREGAGAFVCGEETALIASLEGRRGMPRLRPPFPAERGLYGKPTLINNVETLACVPWILRHGPERFAALGTERSKGTKVFALAGKVRRGGLIEVPMGITIRTIVERIGGGVPAGRQFKAVQIGGPSGGCLPAQLADTPIDYEALAATGAIMGSGGLVVLDDSDCMVDVARFFLHFTQAESCGKCTFCRIGTKRMLEILDRLCEGRGQPRDLVDLEELAGAVKHASLCGLGQTAPNPVLTTLRYFRHEYEAHLEGRCPARRCTALISYRITPDCIGCTLCAQVCPVDAIEYRPHQRHYIDDAKCVRCNMCFEVCPEGTIVVETPRLSGYPHKA